MTAPKPNEVQVPPGMLVLTSYGSITMETVQAILSMVVHHGRSGMNNIAYQVIPGHLVDKARNDAGMAMLRDPNLQWLHFLDADMVFAPDLLQKILLTAYGEATWADIVGGYCQLRGKPYLPTIDTGTGTWEPHDANVGNVEVIRTGGACLLIKRHVLERMEFPWWGVRPAPRPIDMLAEVDNFARCKMDGRNPFAKIPEWQTLENCARQDAAAQRQSGAANVPGGVYSSVGEDSNFTDKAKAMGFRVVVNTNAVCGHVDRLIITPELHVEEIKKAEALTRSALGVLA